jgi:hypothetical protein
MGKVRFFQRDSGVGGGEGLNEQGKRGVATRSIQILDSTTDTREAAKSFLGAVYQTPRPAIGYCGSPTPFARTFCKLITIMG